MLTVKSALQSALILSLMKVWTERIATQLHHGTARLLNQHKHSGHRTLHLQAK